MAKKHTIVGGDTLTGSDTAPNELVTRMHKSVREAASSMPDEEARIVTRQYFDIQRMRVAMRLRAVAMQKLGQPTHVAEYLEDNFRILEKEIQKLLLPYASAHPAGRWMLSQHGIGGVIAAGMLSEIDIEKAPTAGHILSLGGYIPGQRPERGVKRSWSGQLKLLLHYAGESFMKQANREDAYYGQVYKWAKWFEWQRNLAGDHIGEALRALNERDFGEDTHAYKWYSGQMRDADMTGTYIVGKPAVSPTTRIRHATYYKGGNNTSEQFEASVECPTDGVPMLPPRHIVSRAQRRAVKLFVHHLHWVWYVSHFGKNPPSPYAIEHSGHADFYPPPDWKVQGVAVSRAPWQRRDANTKFALPADELVADGSVDTVEG